MGKFLEKIKRIFQPVSPPPAEGFLRDLQVIMQDQTDLSIHVVGKDTSKGHFTNGSIFDLAMIELICDLLDGEAVQFLYKKEIEEAWKDGEWLAQCAGQWEEEGVTAYCQKGKDVSIIFPRIKKNFVAMTWMDSDILFEFWDACRYYAILYDAEALQNVGQPPETENYKFYIYSSGDKDGIGIKINPAYLKLEEVLDKIRNSIKKYDLHLELNVP